MVNKNRPPSCEGKKELLWGRGGGGEVMRAHQASERRRGEEMS